MTNQRYEKPDGEPTNPKEGAGSGVSKSSSTSGDEGPNTTQATGEGKSIVNPQGHVTQGPASESDGKESKDSSK